jgi:hypothetical protein
MLNYHLSQKLKLIKIDEFNYLINTLPLGVIKSDLILSLPTILYSLHLSQFSSICIVNNQ